VRAGSWHQRRTQAENRAELQHTCRSLVAPSVMVPPLHTTAAVDSRTKQPPLWPTAPTTHGRRKREPAPQTLARKQRQVTLRRTPLNTAKRRLRPPSTKRANRRVWSTPLLQLQLPKLPVSRGLNSD